MDPSEVTDADVVAYCKGAADHLRAIGEAPTALHFYVAAAEGRLPAGRGVVCRESGPLRELVRAGLRAVFAERTTDREAPK